MSTNEDIMKLLMDIKEDVTLSKKSLTSVASDISSLKVANEKLFSNLEVCKNNYKSLSEENHQLRKRLVQAESAIQYLQKRDREKNLIMFGVEESENEDLWKKVLDIFNSTEVNIKKGEINSIRRIGFKQGNRPLMIIFNEVQPKALIFKNLSKFSELKIFVSNDLTKEQRIENKETRSKLFVYKRKLDSLGINAQVRNTKLFSENKLYDIQAASKYVQSLTLEKNKEKRVDDESDSSLSISATASPTSRKRGRPPGSISNPLRKKLTTKISSEHSSRDLKEMFQEHSNMPSRSDIID